MPELPDVEVFKQYLDATSLHQSIAEVKILAPEMLKGMSVKELKQALEGDAFESSRRHGKYLFVKLDKGAFLVLHFGMTGFLTYFKNMDKEPAHQRLLIAFSNGYHGLRLPEKIGRGGTGRGCRDICGGKKTGNGRHGD